MAGEFLGGLTPYNPLSGFDQSTFVPAGTGLSGINPVQPVSPGFLGIGGLGMNLDTARLGLGGLQAIGGLWSAAQQNNLAKKAFNFQRGILDTNLANQIKSYNLGVDDKFRSRAVVEGTSAADRDAAIARWSATDQRRGA